MVLSDAGSGAEWLIDKSALVRLGASAEAAVWPSGSSGAWCATAESASLVVLHNDQDFELIAEITGQPVQRLGD